MTRGWCSPQRVRPGATVTLHVDDVGRSDHGPAADDVCELTMVDGLPPGPACCTVVATAPATPFDERTAPVPLAPGGRRELAFHAERAGQDPDSSRHGPAVLGCRESTGGMVVTVGCTDRAYDLDDPAVDRVTRNIVERLSRPS